MYQETKSYNYVQQVFEKEFNMKICHWTLNHVLNIFKITHSNYFDSSELIAPLEFQTSPLTSQQLRKCISFQTLFRKAMTLKCISMRYIFTDCIWFDLNGNLDDSNLWATYDNDLRFFKNFKHTTKIGVWVALNRHRIFKYHFFYDAITKNEYKTIIMDMINSLSVTTRKYIFQQFNHPFISCTEVDSVLISYFKSVLNLEYPYCNLTPIKAIFWHFIKPQVYKEKPQNILHLQKNIEETLLKLESNDIRLIRNSYAVYSSRLQFNSID